MRRDRLERRERQSFPDRATQSDGQWLPGSPGPAEVEQTQDRRVGKQIHRECHVAIVSKPSGRTRSFFFVDPGSTCAAPGRLRPDSGQPDGSHCLPPEGWPPGMLSAGRSRPWRPETDMARASRPGIGTATPGHGERLDHRRSDHDRGQGGGERSPRRVAEIMLPEGGVGRSAHASASSDRTGSRSSLVLVIDTPPAFPSRM